MVFNILVYTSDSADVPEKEWLDTDPMAIEASMSQQVRGRIRGFYAISLFIGQTALIQHRLSSDWRYGGLPL